MAVSRALRRLLRVRDIEEEQSRLTLESAQSDLNRIENALRATIERDHQGRRLLMASVHSGELPDRLGSLEEMHTAKLCEAVLEPMAVEARMEVAERREEFLQRRVDRRQAETLIEEAEARDAIEVARSSQQALDDWFRNQLYQRGNSAAVEAAKAAALEAEAAGSKANKQARPHENEVWSGTCENLSGSQLENDAPR